MLRRLLFSFGGALIALLFVLSPNIAKATTVTPVKYILELDPGEVFEDAVILRNETSKELIIEPTAENFKPAGEDAVPWFYEATEPTDHRTAMTDWLEFSKEPIALQAGEEVKLPFKLVVPTNASPGGHYGAILLNKGLPGSIGDHTNDDSEVAASVGLQSATGPLFIIAVSGDVEYDNSLLFSTLNSKKFFSHLPVDFVTKVGNQGTIHTQPFGDILVKNWFGNRKISLDVNPADGFVLPYSNRTFNNTWVWREVSEDSPEIVKEIKNFGFGKYTAELLFVYDPGGENAIREISFWVIPWQLILIAVAILLILRMWRRQSVKRGVSKAIKKAEKKEAKKEVQ